MGILITLAMYSTPPVSDLSPAPGIKLLLLVLLLLLSLLVVVFMFTTLRGTVMMMLLSCSVILCHGIETMRQKKILEIQ